MFYAGVQPVPLQTITNENPAGPSLGTIPQARFLLSMIHMLSLKHGSNSLSLLLNSGILALTQSILRLVGQYFYCAILTQAKRSGLTFYIAVAFRTQHGQQRGRPKFVCTRKLSNSIRGVQEGGGAGTTSCLGP